MVCYHVVLTLLEHFQQLGNHSSVYERNLGSNQALSLTYVPSGVIWVKVLGQVIRRPINANSGLNFNLRFFFFCSKVFSPTIFSILFRASNHQIVGKKNKTEFAFYAFLSEFKFRTNPRLS